MPTYLDKVPEIPEERAVYVDAKSFCDLRLSAGEKIYYSILVGMAQKGVVLDLDQQAKSIGKSVSAIGRYRSNLKKYGYLYTEKGVDYLGTFEVSAKEMKDKL